MKMFLLGFLALNVVSAQAGSVIKVDTPEEAVQLLKDRNKRVVTFIGFSGKGYKDLEAAMQIAETKLGNIKKTYGINRHIINIGVTPEGIGQVYKIAKQLGFETSGIVSSKGESYLTDEALELVDNPIVVEDDTWGGINNGVMSPTSRAIVSASSQVIMIGGGVIGQAEFAAAKKKSPKIDCSETRVDVGTGKPHEKFLN